MEQLWKLQNIKKLLMEEARKVKRECDRNQGGVVRTRDTCLLVNTKGCFTLLFH